MRYVFLAYIDYGRRGMREETHIGDSLEAIESRIAENGHRLIDASVKWRETINLLKQREFPSRELAQVYISISRRLEHGAKSQDALEQAGNFVNNPVLKVALASAATAVVGGARIDEALERAGFADEDIALIRAMSDAGNLPEAFQGLSEKHQQQASLKSKVRGVLIQPVVYGLLGAIMIWGSFIFLIPRFSVFFTKAGYSPPRGIAQIYALDALIQRHVMLSSVLYWGLLAVIVALLLTNQARRVFRKAPMLRDLLERADASQALTSFALLYESAIRRPEAARRVARSCTDLNLKEAFMLLSRGLEGGNNPADAARGSEFPPFIASTMIGALGANDPDATIKDFRVYAHLLMEDVEMYSKRFETFIDVLFKVMMGVMVLAVFGVTLFPMLATMLNHA